MHTGSPLAYSIAALALLRALLLARPTLAGTDASPGGLDRATMLWEELDV